LFLNPVDEQARYFIRELLKVSNKIKKRKFDSFQQGDDLIKQETKLMTTVIVLINFDLANRDHRYFKDEWEF
tara:strand:- start:175 stop:390 length:216 start_codon:yes stop_codon:yes gene_type:complete